MSQPWSRRWSLNRRLEALEAQYAPPEETMDPRVAAACLRAINEGVPLDQIDQLADHWRRHYQETP
jgi:hypothetical protein